MYNKLQHKILRLKIRAKHKLLKAGQREALHTAQHELDSAICEGKEEYKRKLEGLFSDNNPRAGWQALKKVSGYGKAKDTIWQGDEKEWAENLNTFYARFEKPDPDTPTSAPRQPPILLCEAEVIKVFKAVRLNKAPGPDHLTPNVIKACASEIAPVMTNIFNRSLTEHKVPDTWKESTIIPVGKKANPKEMNDFRPVALTSQVMKCLERVLLKRLTAQTASHMDPNQFAYQPGRSVEDATALLTHRIFTHVETLGCYVRVLFIDFSSAFNTMRPSVLYTKLREMGVDESLSMWIMDYLRGRTQKVRVGSAFSSSTTTHIGAPQGCVLSPKLFVIYTNDHRGRDPITLVVKYADDAAHAGFISNSNETTYRESIDDLVEKCERDDLTLNVKKTKELIIDFRKDPPPHMPVSINGSDVEIVTTYDYLGTTVSNDMTWSANIKRLCNKAWKRIYHLRKLKEFKVCKKIMCLFYRSTIESVLMSGVSVWGGNVIGMDKKQVKRVRKCAERIIGTTLPKLEQIHSSKIQKFTSKVMGDKLHPMHYCFALLPSGRRLRQVPIRTERMRLSLVPKAIHKYNTTK